MDDFSTVVDFLSDIGDKFLNIASDYWWVSCILVLPLAVWLTSSLIDLLIYSGDSVSKYAENTASRFNKRLHMFKIIFVKEILRRKREEERARLYEQRQQERKLEYERRRQEKKNRLLAEEEERENTAMAYFSQDKAALYVDVDGRRYYRDGKKRHKISVGYNAKDLEGENGKRLSRRGTRHYTPDISDSGYTFPDENED